MDPVVVGGGFLSSQEGRNWQLMPQVIASVTLVLKTMCVQLQWCQVERKGKAGSFPGTENHLCGSRSQTKSSLNIHTIFFSLGPSEAALNQTSSLGPLSQSLKSSPTPGVGGLCGGGVDKENGSSLLLLPSSLMKEKDDEKRNGGRRVHRRHRLGLPCPLFRSWSP